MGAGLLFQISLVNSPEWAGVVNTKALCSLAGPALSVRRGSRTPLSENMLQPRAPWAMPGSRAGVLRWMMSPSHPPRNTGKSQQGPQPTQPCLLSTCHVPGTVLDAGSLVRDRTDPDPALMELTCWGQRINK